MRASVARPRHQTRCSSTAFFAGIVYVLHDVGFAGGTFAEQIMVTGITPIAVIALVAVYLLGLMYFVGQGGFKRILRHAGEGAQHEAAASIELVALRPRDEKTRPVDASPASNEPADSSAATPDPPKKRRAARAESPKASADAAPVYQDRISKQAALLQQHYRLSAREAEVMELIARGNTVARIAEELIVSENTIRTHSKRIYAKLAIHKKQELLDLIEVLRPERPARIAAHLAAKADERRRRIRGGAAKRKGRKSRRPKEEDRRRRRTGEAGPPSHPPRNPADARICLQVHNRKRCQDNQQAQQEAAHQHAGLAHHAHRKRGRGRFPRASR